MNRQGKPPAKQIYQVERETTLLAFLLEAIHGKSRNNVKSLLSRGQVSIDGKGVTQFNLPLVPGQEVSVSSVGRAQHKLPFPLLFEDEYLIAINKPAGLLSMATEREKERTAYRMVTEYIRSADPDSRIFIVHRLDKETSGVLVLAKDAETKRALQDNWETSVLRRGYQAVTEGTPQPDEGTIRSQLKETATHRVYSVKSGGKEAVTHYKVLRQNADYALLELTIDTGRKNQIRVQLSDLGCPVAGDKTYGAATNPAGRLCLHANELVITHPVTGDELLLRADTPREFRRITVQGAAGPDSSGRKRR